VLAKRITLLALVVAATLSSSAQDNTQPPNLQSALSKLDVYIRQAMNRTRVPGLAVAVVYRDQVVFAEGYGVRKVDEAAKVDPNTVFDLASVSKPISSTIVAALVGDGVVDWDDRIVELDPNFRLADATATTQVTIRDMFAHRSGLPTGAGDVLEDLGYSRPEILERIRFIPLAGEFRTTYHYSNFGLTEGAIAAAKKAGKTWEEIAHERLFSRLGMTSTSARYSDYENNPNKAALHVLEDGQWRNRFVREADSEAPAGGVSSNVRDLAQWLRLQLANGAWGGQQVVSSTALAETHKGQICRSVLGPVAAGQCPRNEFYGLGWNVNTDERGNKQLSHSGAFLLGTGTSVYLSPSEQLGIVVLTNGTPIGLPESVSLSFLDFFRYGAARTDYLTAVRPVFNSLEEEAQNSSPNYSEMKPPQNASPAKPLKVYAGNYSSQLYGTLEIRVERDRLVLRLPPRGAYYELTHWDGDTFTYYFASENTGIARRGVKFSSDAKQVVIQNLAIENNGVFIRTE